METNVLIAIVILHIAAALLLYSIYLFIKHAQTKHQEQNLIKELTSNPLPAPQKPGDVSNSSLTNKQVTQMSKSTTKELIEESKESTQDIPDLSHTIINSALDGKFLPKQKQNPPKNNSPKHQSIPPRAVHVSKNHDEARQAMQTAKNVLKHWEDEEHLVNYDEELNHIEDELATFYAKEELLVKEKRKKQASQEMQEKLTKTKRQELYNKTPTKHLKSIHQEIYEEELRYIIKTLHSQTKEYAKSKKEELYDQQMQDIENKIEQLTGKRKYTAKPKPMLDKPVEAHVAKLKSQVNKQIKTLQNSMQSPETAYPTKQVHESFFAKLNLFKHKSINSKTEHKERLEQKAVDLVKNISQKVEGAKPIPPQELSTITKKLMTVHKQIWGQK